MSLFLFFILFKNVFSLLIEREREAWVDSDVMEKDCEIKERENKRKIMRMIRERERERESERKK